MGISFSMKFNKIMTSFKNADTMRTNFDVALCIKEFLLLIFQFLTINLTSPVNPPPPINLKKKVQP